MVPGLSLANKSQMLFGVAVTAILIAALAVPWIRTGMLVQAYRLEEARAIADAWLIGGADGMAEAAAAGAPVEPPPLVVPPPPAGEAAGAGNAGTAGIVDGETADGRPRSRAEDRPERPDAQDAGPRAEADDGTAPPRFELRRLTLIEARERIVEDAFLADAIATLTDPERRRTGFGRLERDAEGRMRFRYAQLATSSSPIGVAPGASGLVVVDLDPAFGEAWVLRSRIYIIAAGLGGALAAIVLFWFIFKRLILAPVRSLRETAEQVRRGDLSVRSGLDTGDEFEELGDSFDLMLDRLEDGQAQLQQMNEALDLRVDRLEEVNVALDESNRLKSDFVANVSHELRTPLNSIIGFAELLQEIAGVETDPDPKRLRYLENIVTSGRSLRDMIDELLDMAKIEAGRMEVNAEATSVADVVEALVRGMAPQAASRGVELRTELPESLPAIFTDPKKVRQILYNFLSNAVKFTPQGGEVVIAAARIQRQSSREPGLRLSVRDTGPGIPEDMRDVVFEKFRQVDSGHTRQHGGTGLGLAICRSLAEMLGGEVAFTSEPGQGATFYVDLPLAWQPPAPPPLVGEG